MKVFSGLVGGVLLFASAHGTGAAGAPPNVHELMKTVIAPQTQVVWDVGNIAQDDAGNPDASKLKAADWGKVVTAGGKVKQASLSLAQAERVLAAAPGQKIDGEGGAPGAFGAKDVQRVIDKDPQVFRAFAQALAGTMDQVVAAAQKKDAAKLFEASGRIDQICEDCHVKFWYPNQK